MTGCGCGLLKSSQWPHWAGYSHAAGGGVRRLSCRGRHCTRRLGPKESPRLKKARLPIHIFARRRKRRNESPYLGPACKIYAKSFDLACGRREAPRAAPTAFLVASASGGFNKHAAARRCDRRTGPPKPRHRTPPYVQANPRFPQSFACNHLSISARYSALLSTCKKKGKSAGAALQGSG